MPVDLTYGERLVPAADDVDELAGLRPVRGLKIVPSSSGVEQTCRTACMVMPSGLRLVSVAKSVPERNKSQSTD